MVVIIGGPIWRSVAHSHHIPIDADFPPSGTSASFPAHTADTFSLHTHSTMAAAQTPAKSAAQTVAEATWLNYSGLLCKADAGILNLYVSAWRCSWGI